MLIGVAITSIARWMVMGGSGDAVCRSAQRWYPVLQCHSATVLRCHSAPVLRCLLAVKLLRSGRWIRSQRK